MRILVITYDFPYPTNSGGKSRIYNMIKFSKANDLEYLLFSFTRESFKKEYIQELERIGVSKIFTVPRRSVNDLLSWGKTVLGGSSIFKLLYFDKKIEQKIIGIIKAERIDAVLFESFYASFYISDKIKSLGVRQIFGTENIEHILYYDFAKEKNPLIRKPFMVQVGRVRKEEERAYEKSDMILAVTEEEKRCIEEKTKTPVSVIANGVNSKAFAFKKKDEFGNKLLFVGNFSYFPNVDAMEFFYKEVFLKIPDLRLSIVGKHQEKLDFLRGDNRVKQVDFVEDIREEYYNSDVFVFPVRYGGGTNFKVLEAASCGTPIIAIPDRVAGLGFKAGEHFISAKSPSEFMEGIEKLSNDKKLRDKVSKNSRELVEKEFSWENIGEKLRKVFLTL